MVLFPHHAAAGYAWIGVIVLLAKTSDLGGKGIVHVGGMFSDLYGEMLCVMICMERCC